MLNIVWKGLRVIANCCKNLRGLNLLDIFVVENHVQLWKIIVDMKLTYLAIDLYLLIQNKQEIIMSFQECVNLKALEIIGPPNTRQNYDLSVLSSFPSLVHCVVGLYPCDVESLIKGCPKLKYLKYAVNFHFFNSVVQKNNLQQLYIAADDESIPNTFVQSISAHGGLVHVVLHVNCISEYGIHALIENSPNLITLHIFILHDINRAVHLLNNKKNFVMAIKQKFCDRKLFTCGSFRFPAFDVGNLFINSDMDVASLWPTVTLWK